MLRGKAVKPISAETHPAMPHGQRHLVPVASASSRSSIEAGAAMLPQASHAVAQSNRARSDAHRRPIAITFGQAVSDVRARCHSRARR